MFTVQNRASCGTRRNLYATNYLTPPGLCWGGQEARAESHPSVHSIPENPPSAPCATQKPVMCIDTPADLDTADAGSDSCGPAAGIEPTISHAIQPTLPTQKAHKCVQMPNTSMRCRMLSSLPHCKNQHFQNTRRTFLCTKSVPYVCPTLSQMISVWWWLPGRACLMP